MSDNENCSPPNKRTPWNKGKLGSIGQPVLKAKAKSMEHSFVQNLNNAFQRPPAASEVTHERL
jgi:hypothetical protein